MRFTRLRYAIILLAACLSARAANIPIILVSVTSQQAEVQYTSTASSACTLAIADNSGYGITIWDVDSSMTNANMDLARPDTIVNGLVRKVVLGHRNYEADTAGTHIRSRSLAAGTSQTLTVTCNSGADSGTLTFTTLDLQQGTAYPELTQYCPPSAAAPWGQCWPTIDWTIAGKAAKYIDAARGAIVARITGPGEEQNYPGVRTLVPFAGVKDQSGSSAWVTPTNALTYNGGTYATVAVNGSLTGKTPSNALFLAFGPFGTNNLWGGFNTNDQYGDYVDDLLGQLFASATLGDTVSMCLSIDAQTCWSGVVTRTPSTTPGALLFGDQSGTFPQSPWTGPYNGWPSTQPLPTHLVAAAPMSATISGTAVTLVTQNFSQGISFDTEWAVGSPIIIPTSSCTNHICTIASVTDTLHLIINESQGSLGTQTIQPLNAGVLVWKASGSGTLSLNAAFGYLYSPDQHLLGSGGNGEQCSRVSDTTSLTITGASLPNSHVGFLCQFGLGSVHFWDSTAGVDRWLSDNYVSGYGSNGNNNLRTNPFDITDPKTWYLWFGGSGWGPANGRFFGKQVYNKTVSGAYGGYQQSPITWPETLPDPATTFTYPYGPSDVGTAFSTLLANGSTLSNLYNTGVTAGMWTGVIPNMTGFFNGSSSQYAFFDVTAPGGQDSIAWVFPYDVINQQFTGIINTFTGNPGCTGTTGTAPIFCGRNGSWHTAQPTGALNDSWVNVGRLTNNTGNSNGGGPYVIPISEVWRSTDGVTGSWDSVHTCEQDAGNSGSCAAGVGTLQYAYPCPADTSAYWFATPITANSIYTNAGLVPPSPYYGQNNCIQVMASGQPCTLANGAQGGVYGTTTASAADLAFGTCPWNSALATIGDVKVGDTIMEGNPLGTYGSPCRNCEQLTILKVASGSYPKALWLYRAYDPQDGSYNPYNNSGGSAPGKFAHGDGWGPRETSGNDNTNWFTDFSNPASWIVGALLPGTHGYTAGQAIAPALFGNYSAGGPASAGHFAQIVTNLTDLTSYSTSVVGGYSQAFNGTALIPGELETYSSATAINGTNTIKKWVSDYRTPQTGGAGPGQIYNVTATLVAGTSHVYLMSSPVGSNDYKNAPWYGYSGRWLPKDISGPSSSITDSTTQSFCTAYKAGECHAGSSVGNLYLNVPYIEPGTGKTCWAQAWDASYPCVSTSYGVFGQGMMWNALDADPEGRNFIRLTGLFNAPFMSTGFEACKFTPDGQWCFYKGWYPGAYRSALFAVHIPRIATDTVNRTTFVQIPNANGFHIAAIAGADHAAIEFGYDSTFFACQGLVDSQGAWIGGYKDACFTAASPTRANPFNFATSDTPSYTSCASGCQIPIPAISGRELYYRVMGYSGTTLVFTGPTIRTAVN